MKLIKEKVKLLGVCLNLLLLIGICPPIMAQRFASPTKKVQLGIGLETKNTTREQIANKIKGELKSQNIRATDQEIKTAANDVLNKLSTVKDRKHLLGMIIVSGKRISICISWGKDKDFCKSSGR